MAKKYRLDTPKGQTQQAYDEKGQDEATKVANSHKIVASRLARWFREWSTDTTGPKTTDSGPVIKPVFEPRYRFVSVKSAQAVADAKAKEGGCHPLCYIIGNNGEPADTGRRRYALIPRHFAKALKIEIDVPEFKDGDRVLNLTDPRKIGRIVKAGPDVSEIEWDNKKFPNEPLSNCYLWLQGPKKSKSPWQQFMHQKERQE